MILKGLFLFAGVAISQNLQGMIRRLEFEFPAYVILQFFYLQVTEFNNFSTAQAYQMIMMFMAEYMLIKGPVLSNDNLSDKPAFSKKFQGSENRGTGDILSPVPEPDQEIISLKMAVYRKDLV